MEYISKECNEGRHFDCKGCRCQCHPGGPGWLLKVIGKKIAQLT